MPPKSGDRADPRRSASPSTNGRHSAPSSVSNGADHKKPPKVEKKKPAKAGGFGCCSCCYSLSVLFIAILVGFWMYELEIWRKSPRRWANWIGDWPCPTTVTIHTPTTIEALQEVVRSQKKLRAVATGHSFNTMACPDDDTGAVVDMRKFSKVKVHMGSSDDDHTVLAEAGITMGQLQNEILAYGLTLRVPPGNPAYTLGGCIATGCHNLGQSHAADLLSLELVLHNGTLRTISRGDPDFLAAAVSLGHLGVLYRLKLQILPYRSLKWWAESTSIPSIPEILDRLEKMSQRQKNEETIGNKLVFYSASGVLVEEHWVATGRTTNHTYQALKPYSNAQVFRLGQGGVFSEVLRSTQTFFYGISPPSVLEAQQWLSEEIFRALHTADWLSSFRKLFGWQHSPEARGEGSARPSGLQYTWAGWLDEIVNLFTGLQHTEVIFPMRPAKQAEACLKIVFKYRHISWWRLNIRAMGSEDFLMSSVHHSTGSQKDVFLRTDFVGPRALIELNEEKMKEELARDCPGWRKHWGKALFRTTNTEEKWGRPKEFVEVVKRYDPDFKFRPKGLPTWLK